MNCNFYNYKNKVDCIFNGANEDVYEVQAREMNKQAATKNKAVTVEAFPGTDHFSALPLAVQKMVTLFR